MRMYQKLKTLGVVSTLAVGFALGAATSGALRNVQAEVRGDALERCELNVLVRFDVGD